ncbi:tRNA-splicing endonuclease subunit SEN2 [Candida viswanathii]|uniref:tRNA-splicing endonuclease subunit Sen2 n=1 Tax=Candida viswanathii TaxID=5486 RepID=A0A367XYQ3_9ASCO|nr:tRNA-splicing endonuclease subunit SEN2 [Candida viswanathii]
MGKRNNKYLNKIYNRPLPITLTSQRYNVSLPELYPHNPVSWIWYLVRYLQVNIFYKVPELTNDPLPVVYDGQIFKVTDAESITSLWRQGFFGKGVLSRSEPTWYQRTLTRLNLDESGKSGNDWQWKTLQRLDIPRVGVEEETGVITAEELKEMESLDAKLVELRKADINLTKRLRDEDDELSMKTESYYLWSFYSCNPWRRSFEICLEQDTSCGIGPHLIFIVDYAVYHYFRSNGWCVRSGVKFGTDFLLYKRGPPFIHAEYCILVMTKDTNYDWFEIAAKARVIGSVKKTFVLCYVDYPTQEQFDEILGQPELDHGLLFTQLLEQYRISEVVYKRWNPSRTRD